MTDLVLVLVLADSWVFHDFAAEACFGARERSCYQFGLGRSLTDYICGADCIIADDEPTSIARASAKRGQTMS